MSRTTETRSMSDMTQNNQLVTVETEFAELENGTLLELIEAPWNPQELALATYDREFRQGVTPEDDPPEDEEPANRRSANEPGMRQQFPHGDAGPTNCALEYLFNGRRYIPISADNRIVKQMRLARGISRSAPEVESLVARIESFLCRCLDLEE